MRFENKVLCTLVTSVVVLLGLFIISGKKNEARKELARKEFLETDKTNIIHQQLMNPVEGLVALSSNGEALIIRPRKSGYLCIVYGNGFAENHEPWEVAKQIIVIYPPNTPFSTERMKLLERHAQNLKFPL